MAEPGFRPLVTAPFPQDLVMKSKDSYLLLSLDKEGVTGEKCLPLNKLQQEFE
jgi:hypothetical protein